MLLGSYLSGIGYDCHIDNSAEKCDNCRKELSEASESFEAVEADITEMMMNEVEEEGDFFQMPEVGSSIVLDNLRVLSLQTDVKTFALEFQMALKEAEGKCTVCRASNATEGYDHRYNDRTCKYVGWEQCAGCLSTDHSRSGQCPIKVQFPGHVGICFRCGLGKRIGEVILHDGGYHGCHGYEKDIIFPFCWYIWRSSRPMLRGLVDIEIMTDKNYSDWLTKMQEGVMNAWVVFTEGWKLMNGGL